MLHYNLKLKYETVCQYWVVMGSQHPKKKVLSYISKFITERGDSNMYLLSRPRIN